jgi:pimeloyl-ACP methyl ester carboxylesterase
MDNSKLIVRVKALPKGIASDGAILLDDSDPILLAKSENQDLKPWDQAHLAFQQNDNISFIEPDLFSSTGYYPAPYNVQQLAAAAKGITTEAEYETFMDYWPAPPKPSVWHLDDGFSQIRAARDVVGKMEKKNIIRIAHFDTGYDPKHKSFPDKLVNTTLQRNFVEGENNHDARDSFDSGVLKMPGHGIGTLSILAGNKMSQSWCDFDDYFGLVDGVEIVPIRIAKGVVLLKTSAFVEALDYVLNSLQKDESTRIHIITMSMGGVAAAAWADMVNEAYEKGIFMVTAAGNNFAKLPTRNLIYPARFHRVVAACGVTYDYSPYHKDHGSLDIMEGNYGPRALMGTAVAAFTPNVSWAPYRYEDIVGIRGDGTSSATPQIAAAAALYYKKHFDEIEALPEGWMKVEAIRNALFSSAKKTIKDHDGDYAEFYGNGVLQAADMLNIAVPATATLKKAEKDKVSFPFWRVILGTKGFDEEEQARQEMLETELMQLLLTDSRLQQLLKEEEIDLTTMTNEEIINFIDAVLANRDASDTLKRNLLIARRALL